MLKLNLDCVIVGCNRYWEASLSTLLKISKNIEFNNIFLLTDNNFNLSNYIIKIVKIDDITTKEEYSEFMLYKLFPTLSNFSNNRNPLSDKFMVVQWDGFPINCNKWSDDFVRYDYIGAPWIMPNLSCDGKVGNGGFSIRSYKLMDFISKNKDKLIDGLKTNSFKLYNPEFEDNMICVVNRTLLEENGFTFAPFDIAKRFSCESLPYDDNVFGFHGVNKNTKFLPQTVRDNIFFNGNLISYYERY